MQFQQLRLHSDWNERRCSYCSNSLRAKLESSVWGGVIGDGTEVEDSVSMIDI